MCSVTIKYNHTGFYGSSAFRELPCIKYIWNIVCRKQLIQWWCYDVGSLLSLPFSDVTNKLCNATSVSTKSTYQQVFPQNHRVTIMVKLRPRTIVIWISVLVLDSHFKWFYQNFIHFVYEHVLFFMFYTCLFACTVANIPFTGLVIKIIHYYKGVSRHNLGFWTPKEYCCTVIHLTSYSIVSEIWPNLQLFYDFLVPLALYFMKNDIQAG